MNVMISCGEASGDLYAGALAAELRAREPTVDIVGLGGRRLEAAGGRLIADFTPLTVTGLIEMIRVLPRSYSILQRLLEAARQHRPDVLVAIDFPDFNFRLMAAMEQLGVPVVYYVSPQLWAWRSGRMKAMKRYVNKVLVIFPFEQALYEEAGVPVEFVGHPLVDLVQTHHSPAAFRAMKGLEPAGPTVALLPGSRPNEVHRLAPVLAAAVPLIRARVPGVQFLVACAANLPVSIFAPFAEGQGALSPVLVRGETDDVLAASDVAVTASGTATVQTALHGRPMVVVYKLSPLSYAIGKPFVSVSQYAMPNLVAGREIVPELIQDGCTPETVAEQTVALLLDGERRARTREALHAVATRLGASGASGRAADAVLGVARTGH